MLPYGLTLEQIASCVQATETYFCAINVAPNAPHILQLIPRSAISSLVSDTIIHYLTIYCPQIAKNKLSSGYPDLLPIDKYPSLSEKKALDGIEVKSSSRDSAWDSHNPEQGWFLTVRYKLEGTRIHILELNLARLEITDWSHSPQKTGSRRTATARINKSGLQKLKQGKIFAHDTNK